MAGRKYGLDLGTNYVKIYDNTRKNILVEHNMIAIRKKKDMVAAGDDAYEIYEKVSDNIVIKQRCAPASSPTWSRWDGCLTFC